MSVFMTMFLPWWTYGRVRGANCVARHSKMRPRLCPWHACMVWLTCCVVPCSVMPARMACEWVPHHPWAWHDWAAGCAMPGRPRPWVFSFLFLFIYLFAVGSHIDVPKEPFGTPTIPFDTPMVFDWRKQHLSVIGFESIKKQKNLYKKK